MVDTKYDEQTGEPLWKEQGADTWHPFSRFLEDLFIYTLSSKGGFAIMRRFDGTCGQADNMSGTYLRLQYSNGSSGSGFVVSTVQACKVKKNNDAPIQYQANQTVMAVPNGSMTYSFTVVGA